MTTHPEHFTRCADRAFNIACRRSEWAGRTEPGTASNARHVTRGQEWTRAHAHLRWAAERGRKRSLRSERHRRLYVNRAADAKRRRRL